VIRTETSLKRLSDFPGPALLGPEREMVDLMFHLEPLEFAEGIDGREEMVALGSDGMGRGAGQTGHWI